MRFKLLKQAWWIWFALFPRAPMQVLRTNLCSWHASSAESFVAAMSARTAYFLEMLRRSPLPVYLVGWSFVAHRMITSPRRQKSRA